MKNETRNKLWNLKPKDFILKHLIPFIMRENGKYFDMNFWQDAAMFDNDVCHTACCIGGSIDCLFGRHVSEKTAAKCLGLTEHQADALFFNWDGGGPLSVHHLGWSTRYAKAFRSARSKKEKARAACNYLRHIAKNGQSSEFRRERY